MTVSAVSVRIDAKTLKDIEFAGRELELDRSEVLRRFLSEAIRQFKIKKALELLGQRRVSVGKAAEIAEISIYELMELADRSGIELDYSIQDLEKDIARFRL